MPGSAPGPSARRQGRPRPIPSQRRQGRAGKRDGGTVVGPRDSLCCLFRLFDRNRRVPESSCFHGKLPRLFQKKRRQAACAGPVRIWVRGGCAQPEMGCSRPRQIWALFLISACWATWARVSKRRPGLQNRRIAWAAHTLVGRVVVG